MNFVAFGWMPLRIAAREAASSYKGVSPALNEPGTQLPEQCVLIKSGLELGLAAKSIESFTGPFCFVFSMFD